LSLNLATMRKHKIFPTAAMSTFPCNALICVK
jgi:hypothetical protein